MIVPVYKGRGETLRAIHACLSAPQTTPFTLLAVNDRSPDPELTADLAELAGRGLFHLVENERNLGFVRSVNRALGLRQGRAVVLLNSDAQVFGDWLDRLVAHAEPSDAETAEARGRPPVGSVTPLSNNATICSYPRFNANNTMPLEIARPELDRDGRPDQPRPRRGRAHRRRLLHVHDRPGARRRRRARRRGLRQGLRRGERLVPARHQGGVRQPAGRGRLRLPCRPDLVRAG